LRYTLQGGRSDTPWSLSVWSNNVLNKRYVIGGLVTAGRLYNYNETPGFPRTVGATLSVSF
jgi:outer membrane receptor protein involved in Fe transport